MLFVPAFRSSGSTFLTQKFLSRGHQATEASSSLQDGEPEALGGCLHPAPADVAAGSASVTEPGPAHRRHRHGPQEGKGTRATALLFVCSLDRQTEVGTLETAACRVFLVFLRWLVRRVGRIGDSFDRTRFDVLF